MINNSYIENYFKKELFQLYSKIKNLSNSKSPHYARNLAATEFYKVFLNASLIIKGSEYLPYQSSSIFIYNHLNTNPQY